MRDGSKDWVEALRAEQSRDLANPIFQQAGEAVGTMLGTECIPDNVTIARSCGVRLGTLRQLEGSLFEGKVCEIWRLQKSRLCSLVAIAGSAQAAGSGDCAPLSTSLSEQSLESDHRTVFSEELRVLGAEPCVMRLQGAFGGLRWRRSPPGSRSLGAWIVEWIESEVGPMWKKQQKSWGKSLGLAIAQGHGGNYHVAFHVACGPASANEPEGRWCNPR